MQKRILSGGFLWGKRKVKGRGLSHPTLDALGYKVEIIARFGRKLAVSLPENAIWVIYTWRANIDECAVAKSLYGKKTH